jgi:hypothetical protein
VASTVVGSLLSDEPDGGAQQSSANDAAAMQAQIAKEQWNKYKEIYEPLEKKVVQEAQDYATPENYARAAGDASATVSEQFSKARERLGRTPGLDPSSAGYAASLTGLDLAQAATDATQQNLARKGVTDTAYSRKVAALGLGKGLDATAAQGAASSANTMSQLAAMQNQRQWNQASAIGQGFSNMFNAAGKSGFFNGGSGQGTYNGGLDSVGSGGGGSFDYKANTPLDLGDTAFI